MNPAEYQERAGLREYQELALATDQVGGALPPEIDAETALKRLIPLLGMAGEVGSLLAEYKKYLRDGNAHPLFGDQVAEELGDILWYLANTASKFGLDLEELAIANLRKARRRWPATGETTQPYQLFDSEFDENERLPRYFVAEIWEVQDDDGRWHAELTIDGKAAGSHLRDNSIKEDYYRFHDVFHLAHAAMLGWSPVLRGKLLDPSRKRRSNKDMNEVEDGGRAIVIDEATVAYVWGYASEHNYLEGAHTVDYNVLKTIDRLTSGLEVSPRQLYHWEEAILAGYEVFRGVRDAGRGRIAVNLVERRIELIN